MVTYVCFGAITGENVMPYHDFLLQNGILVVYTPFNHQCGGLRSQSVSISHFGGKWLKMAIFFKYKSKLGFKHGWLLLFLNCGS